MNERTNEHEHADRDVKPGPAGYVVSGGQGHIGESAASQVKAIFDRVDRLGYTAPEIGTCEPGDRVFITQPSLDDWLGVQILPPGPGDAESGSVRVEVVYTNAIPGYELGQAIPVAADLPAYRKLTVDALIEIRDAGNHEQGPETPATPTCGHEQCDEPAVARLVYINQGYTLGDYVCATHATCSDSRCGVLGTIMDAEYDEPWCQPHGDQFTGEEAVRGPDIVALDSDRYREILAEAV